MAHRKTNRTPRRTARATRRELAAAIIARNQQMVVAFDDDPAQMVLQIARADAALARIAAEAAAASSTS